MNSMLIRQHLIVPFVPRWVLVISLSVIAYNIYKYYVQTHPILISVLLYIGMFLILFFLFTSRYQIEIIPEAEVVHPHIWIMGYKIGSMRAFYKVEKIFVNKVRQTQKLYTHYNYSNYSVPYIGMLYIEENIYKSFLKFTNGEKLLFMAHPKHDKLMKKLNTYAAMMNVPLQDNTALPPSPVRRR